MTLAVPTPGTAVSSGVWGQAVTDAVNDLTEGDAAAILAAVSDPMTAYAPALSSSGGGASVGDGTLTGRYQQTGKRGLVRCVLTRGSSTSFGSGFIAFSMPAGWTAFDVNQVGSGRLFRPGFNSYSAGCVVSDDLTKIVPLSDVGVITASVPWTWSTTDAITVTMEIELA